MTSPLLSNKYIQLYIYYKNIGKLRRLILVSYGGLNRLKRKVATIVLLLQKRVSSGCTATISKIVILIIVPSCDGYKPL